MALSERVGADRARGRGGDLHGARRDGVGPDADRRRGVADPRRGRGRRRRDPGRGRVGRRACSRRSTTRCWPRAAADVSTWRTGSRGCSPASRSTRTLLPARRSSSADDLSPSMTATLPREHILGIAARGAARRPPTPRSSPGPTGSRRWSARRGVLAALAAAAPDAELALDGATGEVVVAPDADDDRRLRRARGARRRAVPGDRCRRGVAARGHASTASRSRCSRTSARRPRRRRLARSGPAASACSGPSSCSSSGPRRRPRTSRRPRTARPSRRSAATRSRSGCSTSAATSRSRTCRCRPRTTRSSACGRCASRTTGRSCS